MSRKQKIAPAFVAGRPMAPGREAEVRADGALVRQGLLRCARTSPPCEQTLDVGGMAPERFEAARLAHGWVRAGGPLDGQPALYCSSTCRALDETWAVAERERRGESVKGRPASFDGVKPSIGGAAERRQFRPAESVEPVAGWVRCCRLGCEARCQGGDDPSRAAAFAAAHGYVQSAHGVFCSVDCGRLAALDVESGAGTKRDDPQGRAAAF